MKVSDIILSAIENKKAAKKDIAAKMGWSSQSFSNRLSKNTIDADEWVKIADLLGYEIQMIEKDTGELFTTPRKGVGKQAIKMVNGVIYDTSKSSAIIHTPHIYGCFHELYRLYNGMYFVVTYYDMEDTEPAITPLKDESEAREYYKTCGGDKPDEDFI